MYLVSHSVLCHCLVKQHSRNDKKRLSDVSVPHSWPRWAHSVSHTRVPVNNVHFSNWLFFSLSTCKPPLDSPAISSSPDGGPHNAQLSRIAPSASCNCSASWKGPIQARLYFIAGETNTFRKANQRVLLHVGCSWFAWSADALSS